MPVIMSPSRAQCGLARTASSGSSRSVELEASGSEPGATTPVQKRSTAVCQIQSPAASVATPGPLSALAVAYESEDDGFVSAEEASEIGGTPRSTAKNTPKTSGSIPTAAMPNKEQPPPSFLVHCCRCKRTSPMPTLLRRFDEAREPPPSLSAALQAFVSEVNTVVPSSECFALIGPIGPAAEASTVEPDAGPLGSPAGTGAAEPSRTEAMESPILAQAEHGRITGASPPDCALRELSHIPSPACTKIARSTGRAALISLSNSRIPVRRNSSLASPSVDSQQVRTSVVTSTPHRATSLTPGSRRGTHHGPTQCTLLGSERPTIGQNTAAGLIAVPRAVKASPRALKPVLQPVAAAGANEASSSTNALPDKQACKSKDVVGENAGVRDECVVRGDILTPVRLSYVDSVGVSCEHATGVFTPMADTPGSSSKSWLSRVVAPLPPVELRPHIASSQAFSALETTADTVPATAAMDGPSGGDAGNGSAGDVVAVASATVASEWLLSASEVPFLNPVAGGTSALHAEADVAAWLKGNLTPASAFSGRPSDVSSHTESTTSWEAGLAPTASRSSSGEIRSWLDATASDATALAGALAGVRARGSEASQTTSASGEMSPACVAPRGAPVLSSSNSVGGDSAFDIRSQISSSSATFVTRGISFASSSGASNLASVESSTECGHSVMFLAS
mmetsp:Transcript_8327/g.27482  ORF Transcript_8327/g.27482 Transcript_8327/m.27482 type:complete len:682 (+) Transcript_8327:66-2111(+)